MKTAPGKPLAFSATTAEFSCLNFEARPLPEIERLQGGGYVTVYVGGRVLWAGNEEDMPAHLRNGNEPGRDPASREEEEGGDASRRA